MKLIYMGFMAANIVIFCIAICFLYYLHQPDANADSTDYMIAYIAMLVAIFLFLFNMIKLRKVWHATCFLTSKRLYLKRNKGEDYISCTREDVKSISNKFTVITIELVNGEIMKIPTPVQCQGSIFDLLSEPK